MGFLKGQGATQSSSLRYSTYCPLVGQGATEYLVLLAIVLIVALVSVALLGFFPGMASDAQVTQSQMYWRSTNPISIVESVARAEASSGQTYPYIRLRNTGTYPIRITGLVGGDGTKITQFSGSNCGAPGGYVNISDYFYLGPGEEKYFAVGGTPWYGVTCDWEIVSRTSGSSGVYIGGASSVCQNSTISPGTLYYKTFGFEYITYIEGQSITKRQMGKDLIIKCREPR